MEGGWGSDQALGTHSLDTLIYKQPEKFTARSPAPIPFVMALRHTCGCRLAAALGLLQARLALGRVIAMNGIAHGAPGGFSSSIRTWSHT